MESKGIVEQIVVQNSNNQDEIYDIAASGQNVSYNENMNIVEKIDEIANQIDGAIDGKVNLDGGSLANTVAGDVTSQGSVSEIISTDRGSTIWGKINAIISNLRRKVDSDGGSLENTKAGSISPTSLSSITSSDKGSVIWGKINSLISKTNNMETSLNNKVDKSGGSVANTTAGVINTQSSSTDITSSDTLSTIWGKFNKLREEVFTNHKYSTIYRNSSNLNKLGGPPHGIKYQDNTLQVYIPNSTSSASTQDAGSWQPVSKPYPKFVSWENGTDEEITAMLEAHYNNIFDIDAFWAVGDIRKVTLSSITATYVNESHRQQEVEFVIIGFNHDDLITPINERTKAAITIQQKNCLRDANVADNDGQNNTEHGYMNSTATNVGGWRDCSRRTWCNEKYKMAIPNNLRLLIKTVKKISSLGNRSTGRAATEDNIFLLSEIEIYGKISNSITGEGTQYKYFSINKENKYKLPKYANTSSSIVSDLWWGRSASYSSANNFCGVDAGGGAGAYSALTPMGIAPAFCL